MNWYKKAKMAEIPNPYGEMNYAYCPNCRKWATETPYGQQTWKNYYEMTPQEQMEIDQSREQFLEGNFKVFPKYCPNCSNPQKNI